MSEKVKQVVRLDYNKVFEALDDNPDGRNYLVVSPNGEWDIIWASHQRQWDPWSDNSYVAPIPAVFPCGDDAEHQLAQDMLDQKGDKWDSDEHYEATGEDIGLLEYVEREHSDDWKEWVEEATIWLASAFLDALNGHGVELNLSPGESIWGYEYTDQYAPGDPIEPPFEFKWAKNER